MERGEAMSAIDRLEKMLKEATPGPFYVRHRAAQDVKEGAWIENPTSPNTWSLGLHYDGFEDASREYVEFSLRELRASAAARNAAPALIKAVRAANSMAIQLLRENRPELSMDFFTALAELEKAVGE